MNKKILINLIFLNSYIFNSDFSESKNGLLEKKALVSKLLTTKRLVELEETDITDRKNKLLKLHENSDDESSVSIFQEENNYRLDLEKVEESERKFLNMKKKDEYIDSPSVCFQFTFKGSNSFAKIQQDRDSARRLFQQSLFRMTQEDYESSGLDIVYLQRSGFLPIYLPYGNKDLPFENK